VKSRRYRISLRFLVIIFLFVITGCPGVGDTVHPDEEAKVSMSGGIICLTVTNAEDYQPTIIAINPRGRPTKQQEFTDNPNLTVRSGQLCIPPSFYQFPNEGEFIIEFVLDSNKKHLHPRSIVTGIELSKGQVRRILLNDDEFTR
jgi:hypothetical protein